MDFESIMKVDSAALFQKVAIGLRGEPVPPLTERGATVRRKSHRLNSRDVLLSASRSRLSSICTPIAWSISKWIGLDTPTIPDGDTSLPPSLPSTAISRVLSHRADVA